LKRYLADAEEVMDDGTGSLMQSETYLFDQLHHRILWHPRKSFLSNWQVVDVTLLDHCLQEHHFCLYSLLAVHMVFELTMIHPLSS
jgi:hypothetical protein